MTKKQTHHGHPEPTIVGTAIGLWAVGVIVAIVCYFEGADPGALLTATAVWLGVCFLVTYSLECRNANKQGRSDRFKGGAVLALPIVVGVLWEVQRMA